ncbi:copper chaperone for superoxide dismutase, chloroplastic/cytosolic isoform X1 [Physcomitrium patens]|uniref:Superoxide dismutase copper/zinc binding domain-containing protein n=1 Tax=Physcomitrium patens TaxID=3218 RepID=A0A2K1J3X9_PHYPA|nr:copper chaperone for superoxide dismutase, chloroplastic/cytosolic-like isoform X1 [Physcomitrium patens]PNR36231.1 hypothetical protein PHYPA_022082 [Physcomitrium patens]|eukprot:XP_024400098.1 copper chaperone for superoxide dismutase, chloroplastic/cytosolic-like isoform X1 [Physcomitrella patens]
MTANKLSSKAIVDEFRHQGAISKETNKPVQGISVMGALKNVATGNAGSVSKLGPNQRILEALSATQPSKYSESMFAKTQPNSSACVPMTIAVAEFKGPDVHGVVRFAQENSGLQECSIEAVIDGLAPGAHGWAVHEYGDLTRGALSTGPASNFPSSANSPTPEQQQQQQHETHEGNLGSLLVDCNGHVQSTSTNDRLSIADVIGRSVVLYGVASEADGKTHTRVAAAVIAHSARPSSLNPQLCNCDGSYCGRETLTDTSVLHFPFSSHVHISGAYL